MSAPTRVRVRMFQVGFGDCFLLSVEYDAPLPDGRAERHLLFDFGSSRRPREGRASGEMSDVAKLIQQHTHGVLDVLVVTHRHKDHLSGFADDAAVNIIRTLAPKRVLRPWTETPDLEPTADAPAGDAINPQPGADPASKRYLKGLADAQDYSDTLAGDGRLDLDEPAGAGDRLKNAAAVQFLNELSGPPRGGYLYAGADAGLDELVPGLAVTVLGPPTVQQDVRVSGQHADDPEYWMTRLSASLRVAADSVTSNRNDTRGRSLGPGPVRWLVERLAAQRSHSAARLVRDLDDALNNTSIILLLTIGKLSMLFPGDAQIENWQYTLERFADDQSDLKAKLAGIDLYKVGHHGSRNATPRTLYDLWADRPDHLPRMTALMSTREGVHGKTEATAVPRETLITALRQVAELHSTDDLNHGEEFIEIVADVTGGPFARV